MHARDSYYLPETDNHQAERKEEGETWSSARFSYGVVSYVDRARQLIVSSADLVQEFLGGGGRFLVLRLVVGVGCH